MHIDKLIGSTTYRGILRSYLDEPNADASDWIDEELLDYVNMEHRHLFSTIRNLYEDWFMRKYVFPLVASQYEYTLPRDCINVRKVEYLKSEGVSGSSPNYVVDEVVSDPEEVQEVELSGKDNIRHYTSSNRVVRTNGYYMIDDTLTFLPDSRLGSSWYGRIYYLPTAPDLHRATAQAGASTTITLGANGATTTLGTVSGIDNYYQYCFIEIISGTGSGQIRRISKYDGASKVATVEVAWSTTPDSSSVYSIVSPIKEDFQELIALGAAMRAKGIKVEDDTTGISTMYGALLEQLNRSMERRNHQNPRRVITTQRSGVWY